MDIASRRALMVNLPSSSKEARCSGCKLELEIIVWRVIVKAEMEE